jgi:hypothetical protein
MWEWTECYWQEEFPAEKYAREGGFKTADIEMDGAK